MENFKSSRNPCDLHPRLLSLYARFEIEMHNKGIEYILTCTYRNDADQNALFRQGRGTPGKIVTNARAGESAHNVISRDGKPAACAFDIVIMTNGKPDWDAKNPAWKRAGKLGTELGMDWAGNWESFKEYPHFQLPNWKDFK